MRQLLYKNKDIKKYNLDQEDIQTIDPWDFENNFIKDIYDTFLVFSYRCTWNGSNGYKITDDFIECFYRSYDCSQYIKRITPKNKAILINEYHHDAPTGHDTLIIGLTEKEANQLQNASFENVQKFADYYMQKMDQLAIKETLKK